MDKSLEITIRPAIWPADEAVANCLLQHYVEHLARQPEPIVIPAGDSDRSRIAELWSEPQGVLLLAYLDGEASGCAAVKVLTDLPDCCELKRLWVEYPGQGRGVGRRLVEAAIAWATARGAASLLLDTVPAAMPQAVALYGSLGFTERARYNENAVAGLRFQQLHLR